MPGGVLEYENVKQDVMKYEWEKFFVQNTWSVPKVLKYNGVE